MGKPHVLVIPYPAQGHVIPILELAQCLVTHSIEVTFVNTEFNHKRVMNALSDKHKVGGHIHLVSIPDGMESWEDRNDLGKLTSSICQVMPGKLEELIERINGSNDNKVTCIIADESVGWALEVAEKMQITRAAFWPAAAALLALAFSVPKMIEDGIINNHEQGIPTKDQIIRLSPTMPAMSTTQFVWACIGDLTTQKIIFELVTRNNKSVGLADWLICNSTYELEPAAFSLFPNILPIGPLLASNRLGSSAGYFWPEDSTCLEWLDQQPANSVIYVAFGSFTVIDNIQFQQLASGLERTNRPFLWVVRPDIADENNDAYPEGFKERVATRGRMVGWAPQQKVLNHPSVACFLSHCGWNSTMEGLSNGIPFLCWPYFADQFLNQSYICDVWKVGLGFNCDESGIIKQGEIKDKVEQLLNDKTIKARALDLKEVAAKSVKEDQLLGWALEVAEKMQINIPALLDDGIINDNDPGKLEELIENINGSDNDKIPCIVADELLGWALEVAEKMQIKRAAFWSTATALLALGFRIPELLDDGIIKNNGTVVLAEFTEFTGNFTSIASQCLQKLPSSNNKFTYNCDGHTFNYLVEDGFTYYVVAVESAGRQIPMAFLERVKEDFTKRYGGGKAATAAANSLNREFGPKLKEQIQYCVDHPEEISKLSKVKAQVSEVKGVMMENIEKVLDRREKIELLVDKTENLRSQAQDFRTQGTQMRRKMWLQNMKIKLIVLGTPTKNQMIQLSPTMPAISTTHFVWACIGDLVMETSGSSLLRCTRDEEEMPLRPKL
ncbi:unnamed protein product [Camellia sinensis]